MAENRSVKTEISEEEFKKRVAAKRKELYKKRVIFVAACVGVLILIAGLVFAIIFVINKIEEKKADIYYGTTSSRLQGVDRSITDRIYYTGEVLYLVGDGQVEARLKDGTVLWENTLDGEGELLTDVCGNSIFSYRIGGGKASLFGKKGEEWTVTVDGRIDFASVNLDAKKGVVCYRKGSEKATVRAFAFDEKTLKKAETDAEDKTAVLFEKTFTSDYVISAAVSANGKTVAIGELSENGSAASTKLSLVSVDTGKTYFTKVFDNEVCPFIEFSADNVLVAAGNHTVYTVTVGNGSSSGSKVKQICQAVGENDEILSVAVISGRVAVVSGNAAGETVLSVYELKNGALKSENDGLMPQGVISCGNFFAVYDTGVVRLIGKDCEILGSTETFDGIKAIYGSRTLSLSLEDKTGYTVLWFEK